MQLAERMSRIGIESAFDVLVRARALEAQGRSVIHLEIGEPDFPTPPHVIQAAKTALDEGWTHYGPTQGQPELREAIAAHISRTRGIQVGPQHVSEVPGGVIPRKDLKVIADLLRERDVMVLSDEIYSQIYYGEPPASITEFPGMLEKTIILDGFSKTYAMTGWRMGYGVMPEWLVDAVNKLMVNSNSCTASFTQRAGIAALTGPQDAVTRMVAEFHRRRDAFCDGLNQIPCVRCARPGGAV